MFEENIQPVIDVIRSQPLLQVGLILVATFLITVTLNWLHGKVFRRIARRTSSSVDDTVFHLLHPPIRNTVVLLGIVAAIRVLGMDSGPEIVAWRVALTLGVFFWFVAVMQILSFLLRQGERSPKFPALQARSLPLFDTIQKLVLTGGAVYAVFLIWNIDLTAWVASAGIVGIAVGFAARDTLANLFSGVFIMVDSPYRIGDMVVFETGERGRVTDVGIRSTRILTRDDVEIIVPNSVIGSGKVTNESGGPHQKRRVDVRVGVSYASDVEQVKRLLGEVAAELEVVCEDPEPRVRFREMGDSSLIFSLLFWITNPELRGAAVDEVNTRIFQRFREEGVEIPFPQRVLHFAPGSKPGE